MTKTQKRSPSDAFDAAYDWVVALARADGRVRRRERRTLRRIRRSLGLRRSTVGSAQTPADQLPVPESVEEQASLLELMAQVIFADGGLSTREHRLLQPFQRRTQIPPLRWACILDDAAEEALHRRRQRLWLLGGLAALAVVAAATIGLALGRRNPEAISPDEFAAFSALADRSKSSLVLVETRYAVHKAGVARRRFRSAGTGFFISEEGHVATSKHVIRPWLFQEGVASLLQQEGYTLDPASVEHHLWPVGALLDESSEAPWCTCRGSVSSVITTPDVFDEPQKADQPTPTLHRQDDSDLAILQCGARDRTPLALQLGPPRVKSLDRVMAMGFPQGYRPADREPLEPTPVIGRVRRVVGAIEVTTPVLAGNSGGPLVDESGSVAGIVTWIRGSSTYGRCIPSQILADLAAANGVAIHHVE